MSECVTDSLHCIVKYSVDLWLCVVVCVCVCACVWQGTLGKVRARGLTVACEVTGAAVADAEPMCNWLGRSVYVLYPYCKYIRARVHGIEFKSSHRILSSPLLSGENGSRRRGRVFIFHWRMG